MKANLRILTLAAALCVGLFTTNAADDHGHAHKATPKGGRLLDKTEPHAEFVIEQDRTVTINFYSDDMKPVAAMTQVVTVIADAKSGKATLEFEKKGDLLLNERRYNRFLRSFTLPPTVDEKTVNAKLADGVLSITLNKREETKPRKIQVS